jgi:hypothetical protein
MYHVYLQSRFNAKEYFRAASFATTHADCPSESIAMAHLSGLEAKGHKGFATSDDLGDTVTLSDEAQEWMERPAHELLPLHNN